MPGASDLCSGTVPVRSDRSAFLHVAAAHVSVCSLKRHAFSSNRHPASGHWWSIRTRYPPGMSPGQAFSGSGQRTGAPAHANSICAYNGLNDMNPAQGPIDSIVQTPHTQGSPGDAGHGTCAGGTNPENPPTP